MSAYTMQQREEPTAADILAQLENVMATVQGVGEVLSSQERVALPVEVESAVALQQHALTELPDLLHSIRQRVEYLHSTNKQLDSTNKQLEMDIHRKNSELVEVSLNLLRKQKLLDDFIAQASMILQAPTDDKSLQLESLKRILTNDTNHDFDWNSFQKQFTKVHPKFVQELFRQCPTLTPTEVKVSCLMKIGLSTKEIMQLMRVTIRDIETHRYKIRKKLGLPTKVNLVTYLSGLHPEGY